MGEKFQHPEFQEIQGNMDACKGAISGNRTIPYMRGSGPLPPFGGGRGPELAEGHKGRRRLCRPVSDRLTLASLGALTGRQGPGTLASAGLRPRGLGKFEPGGKPPGPCTGYVEQISDPTSAIPRPPGQRSLSLCRLLPYPPQTRSLKTKNPQAKPAAGVKLSLTAKGLAGYPAPFLLIFPGAWYKRKQSGQ